MRFYLTILVAICVLLPLSSAWALPECEGSPVKEDDREIFWTNCVGTYTYANGEKYVGGWKDGKKHGQGTYTYPNGKNYVGEFKDDKKHGQGTYTWADGKVWDGQWKDGKWDNGRKYFKGEWKLFLIVLLITAVSIWICRS